ncbi:MAG: TlpA family protein disulfide reductase [Eggerthellaceae bacterium]|nr:TlpA family protein disulfide reductase [Eggerthellaceae bacterium]
MNSKNGVLVSVVAIVAVIGLAALGYNVLKGEQNTELPNLGSAAATSSAADDGQTSAAEGSTSDAADAMSSEGSASDATDGAATESSASAASSEYLTFADFSIKTLDGESVQLSSFYGKPTLMSFWATWCPPCNAEAPEIQKLWESYGDRVNIVMVDASVTDGRDTPEKIKKWMEDGGYSYPVYYDETGEAALETEVYYLPTMYVLDKEGRVLTAFSGALDEASGAQLIEQLLAL